MSFPLTEEQVMIQNMVRDLARERFAPHAAAHDREKRFPAENLRQLAELGLMGMMVPPEYGGAGADTVSYVLALSEVAYACAATAVVMSVHNSIVCESLLRFGTDEQKERFLRPLAAGEIIGAFSLTEPNAGSDAVSITSRAVRKGDSYVLNGTKTFITNGSICDYVLVAAYTDPSRKAKGISLFLVDRGTPGFHVARKLEKAGLRSADTAELVFEDCTIPADRLLGAREGGFGQIVKTLVGGRISYGGRCAGVARGAYDVTTRYLQERSQFGRPLISFQVNQFKVAEWAMYIDIMHTITWKAAWLYDQGRDCTREASFVKLFCSETAQKIVNEAIQLFGGYGFMMEYPIQRIWRDSRVLTITEGVSEVHHGIIFNSLGFRAG